MSELQDQFKAVCSWGAGQRLLWPLRYTLGIYLRSYLSRYLGHSLTLG